MLRRILIFAGAVYSAFAAPAMAQSVADYPNRPVTLVVPFAAGGPTDTLGRLIANKLSEKLGKQFIVENKAGAGGNTGSAQVARATPDGYMLVLGTVSTHGINPSLYRNMPYDHRKDFAPVSQLGLVPSVLVVNAKLPAKTVPELITYVKENKGKVSYASPGAGTSIHLAAELFKLMADIDMTHIPYRGSAPAMQDVISGQVQMMFDNTVSAWPHVQAGSVRALAVTTTSRLKIAPDLPAMAEFLPGFLAIAWHGVFAPAGTPPAIVDKLSQAVQEIMREPDMVAQMTKLDITPVGNTPEQFAKFIGDDTERWATVVNRLKLKID